MSEPAAGAAEGPPSPAESEQAKSGSSKRLSFALVGKAAAVVGLIGGIVGLLFTFLPGLRPEPPAPQTAKVELADVNGAATLREYLGAEGIPAGSMSSAALQRLGVLATIHYSSTGLGGKQLPLVVSLTSRQTGRVVCRHTYSVEAGGGSQLTFRSWSPFPAHPHVTADSYNLHVTLFPPDGKIPSLDAADHDGIPLPSGGSNAVVVLDVC